MSLLPALVLLWGLSACAPTGDPNTSGTNTSWLKRCALDRECESGSCIDFLCTATCEPGDDATCAQAHAGATCQPSSFSDQFVCDYECSAAEDCAPLGEGYRCESGRCRAPGAKGLQYRETALDVRAAPEAEEIGDVDVSPTMATVLPRVAWFEDHWRIVFARLDFEAKPPMAYIDAVDVGPEGELGRDTARVVLSESSRRGSLRQLPDGTIFLDTTSSLLGPCQLHYLLPDAMDAPVSAEDCSLRRALAIPGTEDWWVLGHTETKQHPTLGRYRPREARWITKPHVVWPSDVGSVEALVDEKDLVLVAMQEPGADLPPTRVARLAGLLAEDYEGPPPEVETWTELPTTSAEFGGEEHDARWDPRSGSTWFEREAYYGPSSSSGALWRSENGARLLLAPLGRDNQLQPPIVFEVAGPYSTTLCGSASRKSDLLAFVHGQPSLEEKPMLSLFDSEGDRVLGPLPLGVDDMPYCMIEWSDGDSLAVVWPDGEADSYAEPSGYRRLNTRVFELE